MSEIEELKNSILILIEKMNQQADVIRLAFRLIDTLVLSIHDIDKTQLEKQIVILKSQVQI